MPVDSPATPPSRPAGGLLRVAAGLLVGVLLGGVGFAAESVFSGFRSGTTEL